MTKTKKEKVYYFITYHYQAVPHIMKVKSSDSGLEQFYNFKIIDDNTIEHMDGWNITKSKLNEDYFYNPFEALNKLTNDHLEKDLNRIRGKIEEYSQIIKRCQKLLYKIGSGKYEDELFKIPERDGFVYFISSDKYGIPYIKQTNLYKIDKDGGRIHSLDGYCCSYSISSITKSLSTAVKMLIKKLSEKIKESNENISALSRYNTTLSYNLSQKIIMNKNTLTYDEVNDLFKKIENEE